MQLDPHTNRFVIFRLRGLCGSCGKRPPADGKSQCDSCRQRATRYRHARRERKLGSGICLRCTKPSELDNGHCRRCHAMKLRAKRDWHKRTKEEVFAAYGGYCCVCCGEVRKVFLAIDHVNNDGAEHRKKIGGPAYFYKWLKRNNFPPGFQVLCFNCNWAKAHGGCPHQTRHREMLKNLASVPLTY